MSLSRRDLQSVWHPYQFFDADAPMPIVTAKGATITLENGDTLIDAISSWWVNIHGHSHPAIAQAIFQQAQSLDHVIFSGFTHEPAVALAERLLTKLPDNQKKIFFSDNGSTAVEVAVKMAIQYWWNQGKKRDKIVALVNGYHGDTFGAMAAGYPGPWVAPFKDLFFEVQYLPHPSNTECVTALEQILNCGDVAAFIFEPLVQGAGGMIMHQPEELQLLVNLCKDAGVPTIADEVMTGFGRTGRWFASSYLESPPDIICLSKGITGGVLPLAVTSCCQEIYEVFQVPDRTKTFFHGHSYTGNPISCAAAIASFDLLNRDECWQRIRAIEQNHQAFAATLSHHSKVSNVRTRGTILAFDVNSKKPTGYLNPVRDHFVKSCRKSGVLIRPLGNILYVMPPYCVSEGELLATYEALLIALEELP